jgi:hypothetical protein
MKAPDINWPESLHLENNAAAPRVQEQAALVASVSHASANIGNITRTISTVQLTNGRELRDQPHIGTLQTFPPACGSAFPDRFCLHRYPPFACIGFTFTSASGKSVHPLRQLGQYDLSGPSSPQHFACHKPVQRTSLSILADLICRYKNTTVYAYSQ